MHFIGQHVPENVAKIHNISRFSVMASRSEGFGLACLEAMACGLPVVVTRCGGPEHFAVGKILDEKSPELLAQAILDVLGLPEVDYQRLSQQASHVAEQYSWECLARKHLDVVLRCVK